MDFIYDNAGRPFALKYSNDGGETFTTYYYILNFQGDVVALLNASGTVVARYTYNAWGEILSVTTDNGTAITNSLNIAHINPLRYRGYYYDSETGFYYLQSRYYDPENCRFINADCYTSTGLGFLGYNMFAYCNNAPILYSDSSGRALNCNATVAIFDEGGPGELWIHESISLYESYNKITITAYLDISGPLDPYIISSGIESNWEGTYCINGVMKEVDIVINEEESKYGKSIPFITSHADSASNTVGPVNMDDIPTVYIYTMRNGGYNNPLWTSAHEFGHCLGLEDYYTHKGDPRYEKDHVGIMTTFGNHATAEEISMVLQAFYTGQYQYWEVFVP